MTVKPEVLNLRSEKIQAIHLERLAVVYVRQSTLQQVLEHQESTRLQYGLVDCAESVGWLRERVLVVDEDLGKSGATAVGRTGFQRLVAEVSLNHVGLILGVEMSRLARCSKDWHQLLEVCALFRTLIADLDGIYDPSQYNDRLLLGLKGTTSEAELHVLKKQYPTISKSWLTHWTRIIPFFAFPAEIRKAIYTTNAIESMNMTLRKVLKNHRAFPTDEFVLKVVYLAIQNVAKKWTMPIREWRPALNQFAIAYEDRFPL